MMYNCISYFRIIKLGGGQDTQATVPPTLYSWHTMEHVTVTDEIEQLC